MRTKTLLAAAAIIAAGLASSQAQSNVYSLNIVGYVNVVLQPGFNLIVNPLKTGVSNGVNEVMAGLPDASIVSSFSGGVYDTRTLDTGDWIDSNFAVTTPPLIPPGKGFFCYVPSLYTNTFVGTVVPAPGGSNTMSLPPGFSLIGSPMPVGGTVTNSTFNLPTPDACIVSKFAGGVYDTRTLDTGDWIDSNFAITSVPSISVGQGFFYYNPGSSTNWVQTLP